MAVSVKHRFVSPVADAGNPEELGPNEWNDTHVITGLENVDNTSDADKPISTATQDALDLKANEADVTNVDNTSDADKPVSTAQQTALDLKANIASPTFTGTVGGITKTMVGLGSVDNTSDATKNAAVATLTNKTLTSPVINSPTGIVKADVGLGSVDNTSDADKPVSTAQQTALNLKSNLASPTFTGTPAAPTAAVDTNTTQLATTAYVVGQAASVAPLMDSTAAVGTSKKYARQDHVHPKDTVPLNSPEFYGCAGNGTTDDTANFLAAVTAGPVVCKPGAVYKIVAQFTPPDIFDVDLNGATLLLAYQGADFAFKQTANIGGTTWDVTTAAEGANFIQLSVAPTGLSVGDWTYITATDMSGRWPPFFAKNIAVNTGSKQIGFPYVLPTTYSGTITLNKITWRSKFHLRNGTIDFSGMISTALGGFNINGYKSVLFEEVDFVNVGLGTGSTNYIVTASDTLEARYINCTYPRDDRNGNFISTFNCGYAHIEGCSGDGEGFATAISTSDDFSYLGNRFMGRFHALGGAGLSQSIRGLKVIGCIKGKIIGNTIRDFDSGIKLEDSSGIIVDGNNIEECEISVNMSNENPNVRNGKHIITGNNIRRNLGSSCAIFCGDGLMSDIKIANNNLSDIQYAGIDIIGTGNVSITGNLFNAWGVSDSSKPAISINDDATNSKVASGSILNNSGVASSGRTLIINASTSSLIWQSGNQSNVTTDSIGDYVKSSVLLASSVSMTSGTAANITSISLPPGEWDVEGDFATNLSGATITTVSGAISAVSATFPTIGAEGGVNISKGISATSNCAICTGRARFSLTSTTTIYLIGVVTFTGGTMGGYGFLSARRIR